MAGIIGLERNKKAVEDLSDIFTKNGVFLIDYRGLNVPEMETLRGQIRDVEGQFRVIKNRFAIQYFKNEKKEQIGREVFNGPIAVAYSDDKYVELAKVIADFVKETKKITIKSGFLEKELVDAETIISISKLPSKEQLLSQVAFSIAMPLKKMGMMLTSPLKNVLVLMNNLKDKKEKEGEG